ncbi:MAG: hypothetical protein GX892_03200 [Thermoanaerobacteraceae bacterium]|nr:hypothetical protein [Thermoanaerobacteraceae bacterium]
MRIYLTQTSNINSAITSQDVISAYVTQKQENGYIVNMGGTEVFAHCLLDLNIGDFLKLKVVESSTSQIVFKVVEHETESQNPHKPLTTLDIAHTQEAQNAFNLLSKLNLPIIKERVDFIMDLFNQLINEEKPEPSLLSSKELPFQTLVSSFRETIAAHIDSGFILPENQLLELLQNFTTVDKDKPFSFNKALTHKRTKASVLKEQLALKAINILHNEDSASNICFFALPIPVYHNTYLKISSYPSTNDTQPSIRLSFIINTKNFGAIFVDLMFINGKVTASSIFEDKKAMNAVKKFLNANKDIPSVIKTMELKVGKVSKKDFFFGDIKKQPITSGINIKI